MANEKVSRRLAAIFAADMVGYSRLVETDEEGTIARHKAHRKELIDPKITEYRGRIVKVMGDGILAEFASVVDAVRCAVGIQQAVTERESTVPEVRRIRYRIGINLGDIVADGDDIFGDGVNVAARLEGLADPGDVWLSEDAYRQVRGKVDLDFEDMGAQEVKNIVRPVRAYRAITEGGAKSAALITAGPKPAPPLPAKPSIAVLPFVNMSGDPAQEYFSDGIAEDIITALSRFRWFFVIARNSSFRYRGTAIDVEQVSRDLGVQYVLQGSVRKGGNRVRVTVQLIDATTGHHIWAEQYDRELEDIFAVQDEITQSVIASVAPEFLSAEVQRAQRKDTRDLGTWELIMRARWHATKFGKAHNAEAQRLLHKAIELDPENALAYSSLAFSHIYDVLYGWGDSAAESIEKAGEAAHQAVAIDDRDAWAQAILGRVQLLHNWHDESINRLERAVALNPNLAYAYGQLGLTLGLSGQHERAEKQINEAIRLSPRDPMMAVWLASLSILSFYARKFDAAADWAKRAAQENPDLPISYRILVAAYGQVGRAAEAAEAMKTLLTMQPGLTVAMAADQVPPTKDPADKERYLDALRRAGLPG